MTEQMRRVAALRRRKRPEPERDTTWRDKALCAQVADKSIFFPASGRTVDFTAAKRVCMMCEVRAECLDWAMTRREQFGVWGGMSETQRATMRRNRNTTL